MVLEQTFILEAGDKVHCCQWKKKNNKQTNKQTTDGKTAFLKYTVFIIIYA